MVLKTEVDALVREYSPEQIVILSVRRDDVSAAAGLSKDGDMRLVPLREAHAPKKVRYGSIYAFKGMEAAAIVLTDIDDLESSSAQRLLYVGMSRARVSLRMLMMEGCRRQYARMIRTSLQQV